MISKRWIVDSIERVGFTYVETLCGLLLTNAAGFTSMGGFKAAAIAAVPAGLAAIKTVCAGMIPGTVSPGSMASDPTR